MEQLCRMWGVSKSHTTPYHPQANGMVERNNRNLGDSLRALLLTSGHNEWDSLLPQLMRAFRGTPHTTTGQTANYMMLGRELRLPDQLVGHPPFEQFETTSEYVLEMQERLTAAHNLLRDKQTEIRHEDQEEHPLFKIHDWVWMTNKRRRKGETEVTAKIFRAIRNPRGQSKSHIQINPRWAGVYTKRD